MHIPSMFAANYRSPKAIRMDMAEVNLFIGEDGVGKSNLYRALQLIQAAVRGSFSTAPRYPPRRRDLDRRDAADGTDGRRRR